MSEHHSRKSRPYRSRIARHVLLQYFFSLLGFVIGLCVLVLVAWQICASFVWHPYDALYQLLRWIRDYILLVGGAVCLVGWTLITYYFMSKPLRYLDQVVAASGQLVTDRNEPIVLPESMKNVQDELNLFREQAIRSEAMAKEAEQRKNDLIVYLAHDLKTPLTSVIGYLTLLQDEPQLSAELRARYTGIALEKALRLEDLVNEFFDITRFNLTALTLDLERVDLTRMLSQIISEFSPILAEKGLFWETDLSPGVELIFDANKLERVFDNLIRNAVNYSYENSAVSLSMRVEADKVQIVVKNHGRTIPPDKLSRIFEQFFRLDSSRASSTGGAGLGLAISKEIVELHHGAIRAESENESIAFTVLLPMDCQKIV